MLAKALQGAAKSAVAAYIEDVFSTYLYTGTGSSQTITNNIDTTTYGGLVWIKGRSGATGHRLTDTARGTTKSLESNSTAAEATESTGLTAFGTTGFTIGADADYNTNAATYVSWTLRKQAKFFDVVTYTGNGVAGRTISHNLGSVPGCMIVKNLTTGGTGWVTYHRSLGNTKIIELNSTAAAQVQNEWNNTDPTSTVFSVYSGYGTNFNGDSYVAYLFAHDAGGFGAAGTDNVISCGSYTGTGALGNTITLGYEPQWVMIKRTDAAADWRIYDVMRNAGQLEPNTSDAEAGGSLADALAIQATGFGIVDYTSGSLNANGGTYIYIAIRRGPMKTPTSGTSVFSPEIGNGSSPNASLPSAGDMYWLFGSRTSPTTPAWLWADRLRGFSSTTGFPILNSSATAAETSRTTSPYIYMGSDNRFQFIPAGGNATWRFSRAPGFFDVVCYTGTGSFSAFNHNLTVTPEFFITKDRANASVWYVYHKDIGVNNYLVLNTTAASAASSNWIAVTSTTFSINLTSTWVAYLFATVTGVSKVGTYVGNATVNGQSQNIDCGFTAGARFVMIKCTSTTGDWYVFDSARGIVAGNDPFLFLNSTAAETTSLDCVDPYSQGFTVVQQSGGDVNVNNATYIFLAIA